MNLTITANEFYRNKRNVFVILTGLFSGLLLIANIIISSGLKNLLIDNMKSLLFIILAVLSSGIIHYLFLNTKKLRQTLKTKEVTENLIENVFNNLEDSLVVLDRNFRIIKSNEAFNRFISVNRKFSTTNIKHCFEVLHGINRPCYEMDETCPVMKVFENGVSCKLIHTHFDSEGRRIYMEVAAYPVKDSNGNVMYCAQTIRDLTDRIKIDELKMNEKKIESIGTLAGGIAHNFNNMLAAIVCYGNLAKMKLNKNESALHYIEKILEVSDKISNITNNLLAYGCKSIINPHPVKLNEIIKSIEHSIKKHLDENITLELKLSENEPMIIADKNQIERLITNLVNNAVDAMPEGGEISIETNLKELSSEYINSKGYGNPGRYACISFKDTGTGIKESIKHRIFDPFFTTKDVGKGDGLGLAATYGIVRQHKGYIDFFSEEGKGTTFNIYFPLIAYENKESSHFVLEAA